MRAHISVHVYGACGAPCPGLNRSECIAYLDRFYKFLLVFEPFLCQERNITNLS
jgi:hypothetical protein